MNDTSNIDTGNTDVTGPDSQDYMVVDSNGDTVVLDLSADELLAFLQEGEYDGEEYVSIILPVGEHKLTYNFSLRDSESRRAPTYGWEDVAE